MTQTTKRKPGQTFTNEELLELSVKTKDMVVRGIESPTRIAREFNVTTKTAMLLRHNALILISKESLDIEKIRKRNVSQYTSQIEKLSCYAEAEDDKIQQAITTGKQPDYRNLIELSKIMLKWHERRDRITGLDTVNVNIGEAPKRIVFIRPGDKIPSSVQPAVEGEIVEPSS